MSKLLDLYKFSPARKRKPGNRRLKICAASLLLFLSLVAFDAASAQKPAGMPEIGKLIPEIPKLVKILNSNAISLGVKISKEDIFEKIHDAIYKNFKIPSSDHSARLAIAAMHAVCMKNISTEIDAHWIKQYGRINASKKSRGDKEQWLKKRSTFLQDALNECSRGICLHPSVPKKLCKQNSGSADAEDLEDPRLFKPKQFGKTSYARSVNTAMCYARYGYAKCVDQELVSRADCILKIDFAKRCSRRGNKKACTEEYGKMTTLYLNRVRVGDIKFDMQKKEFVYPGNKVVEVTTHDGKTIYKNEFRHWLRRNIPENAKVAVKYIYTQLCEGS